MPETKDAMWELMQTLDAGTEIGRSQIATLLEVTSTSDAYYKSLEKTAEISRKFNESINQQIESFGLAGQGIR